MFLEDGKGTGNKAEVDEENKLEVSAVTLTQAEKTNIVHGDAYRVNFICSGLLPNAPFLYIKNTDQTKQLVIQGVVLHTECPAVIVMKATPTITTILGTANVPVNANIGAGNIAQGTFYTAMSGAVSGMTGGTLGLRMYCQSGASEVQTIFPAQIVVQRNFDVAFYTENATTYSGANIAGRVPIYYHEP